MITLSIYKKMIKRCGDIRNLHKAVKILWRNVELRSNNEQTKSTASKRKTNSKEDGYLLN
jgi:hypothetical protein